jgi:glycopeptide antibiotics resistance protein
MGSRFIALLFGLGISVSIETLQFFLKRGFAEVDDVMHNIAGCVIGYGVYKLVRYGYKRLGKRSVVVL